MLRDRCGWGYDGVYSCYPILPFLVASIKIVREHERAVIFRLGRLKGTAGPGIFFIIPIVDKLFKVDPLTMYSKPPSDSINKITNIARIAPYEYIHITLGPARRVGKSRSH